MQWTAFRVSAAQTCMAVYPGADLDFRGVKRSHRNVLS